MTGEYSYVLDTKGRMAIPAKLRPELGDTIYVSKGTDNCLFVYSDASWAKIEEKLAALPISKAQKLQRTLLPTAARFDLDAQGRILLPQKLREYAGIQKDVVIVGVGNRAEIWSEAAWSRFDEEELTPENMLAAMDELGF